MSGHAIVARDAVPVERRRSRHEAFCLDVARTLGTANAVKVACADEQDRNRLQAAVWHHLSVRGVPATVRSRRTRDGFAFFWAEAK